MSLRSFFSRKERERARVEEMQAHLDLYIEQLEAQGHTPDEARREARLRFGNPRVVRERVDALNGIAWLDALGRDLRYTFRSLRRSPGFTAVVLAVLALGMGGSIAVFAVVDTMVLRPLPFDAPGRLVAIVTTNNAGEESSFFAAQDAADLRARQDVFDGLVVVRFRGGTYKLRPDDLEERAAMVMATADLFHVLRAAPQLGRLFTVDDEVAGRDDVVLISDRFWQRHFNRDRAVLGRTITIASTARRIIGVMPSGFDYPVGRPDDQKADFWAPYVLTAQQRVRGNTRQTGDMLVGRLRPGVTMAQANTRIAQIGDALHKEFPAWFAFDSRFAPKVVPLRSGYVGIAIRPWLYLLLGAVVCVVLLSAVNLVNLVLARAASKSHEFGIRTSLGAARWQIVRAMAVETLVLSMAGMALACGVAWWAVHVLRAAMPAHLPFVTSIALNARIVTIVAGATILMGILLGVLSGAHLARRGAASSARDESRGYTANRRAHRIRAALVIIEVSLAIVLAVGAGLFVTSFMRVVNFDMGIEFRNVQIVSWNGAMLGRGDNAAQYATAAAVIDRLSHLPGIERAAAITNNTPLVGGSVRYSIKVEGQDKEYEGEDMLATHVVTPEYLDMVRLRLLRGRWFTQDDVRSGEPVVVVSQLAADKYFGGSDALKARVSFGDATMRRVIGVVGNVYGAGPEGDVAPELYEPAGTAQRTSRIAATVVVRTIGNPTALREKIQSALTPIVPSGPIELRPMESLFDQLLVTRRFYMTILSIFGAMGVVIAAIGLYGVMAYVVAQRTKEIGVRMALGATTHDVMRSVLARASVYVAIGLAIGLTVAWLASTSVANLLFKVEPRDVHIYATAAITLVLAGLIAAWAPARRAARVDPIVALRE